VECRRRYELGVHWTVGMRTDRASQDCHLAEPAGPDGRPSESNIHRTGRRVAVISETWQSTNQGHIALDLSSICAISRQFSRLISRTLQGRETPMYLFIHMYAWTTLCTYSFSHRQQVQQVCIQQLQQHCRFPTCGVMFVHVHIPQSIEYLHIIDSHTYIHTYIRTIVRNNIRIYAPVYISPAPNNFFQTPVMSHICTYLCIICTLLEHEQDQKGAFPTIPFHLDRWVRSFIR
jgi:hypothetical protein